MMRLRLMLLVVAVAWMGCQVQRPSASLSGPETTDQQAGPATASGTGTNTATSATVAGGDWAVAVAMTAALIVLTAGALVGLTLWLRSRRQLSSVAEAVADLGAGPQRDRLLDGIKARNPSALDRFVNRRGVAVKRRNRDG